MNLLPLAYLACPAMMLFCMKGMFGKKNADSQTPTHQTNHQPVGDQSENEIRALQLQVADLIEENHRLKQQAPDTGTSDKSSVKKVLYIADEREEKKALS